MEIDKDLLNACINSDRRSQSKLYELSFSSLMSIAIRYKINREDSIVLINNCFLKVLKNLESHQYMHENKSYFSWIQKIMIHTIIDDFRKNKKENEHIDYHDQTSYLEQLSANEYGIIESRIEEESLQAMLSQLTETQRQVFNMYAIDGYSHKEIANALVISIDNSKYHLSKARKCLQKMLLKQLEEQKLKHNA